MTGFSLVGARRDATRAHSERPARCDGRRAYDASGVGGRHLIAMVLAVAALASCGGTSAQRAAPPAQPVRPAIDRGTDTLARPRVPAGPRDAPVPILMYHVVAAAPPGTPYPELWVSPSRFADEVAALARAGYHATTLDAVWRAWHGHATMPRHPIVLSFDDGYQSQSTVARRTLDRIGWPGVLNLAVKNVDLKGGLSRREVSVMVHDGWEIDAHTLTHVDLTAVDAVRLRHEVAGSRSWLRRAFGVPVDFFCYPAGRYDAGVEAAVHAAGYAGATTTNLGIASHGNDPYALPRVRVSAQMTVRELMADLHRLAAA
jgi:peptidoglycan/xylan/chitin deacetylase (PgdA/CDA1 family)